MDLSQSSYRLNSTICGWVARYRNRNISAAIQRGTVSGTYQDQIAELLHLHTRLERKLKFASFDDDVREIKQVNLERI